MRICSLNLWNVNHDPQSRLDIAGRRMSTWGADIVCLQEVSIDPVEGRPQTDYLRGVDGFSIKVYSSQGRWQGREEGLAILSKYPAVATESFMLPDAENDVSRRLLVAVFEISGMRLLVANTHLSYHSGHSSVRLDQCKHIVSHLENAKSRYGVSGIVLTGDFNCTPESEPINTILCSTLKFDDAFAGTHWRRGAHTFSATNPYVSKDLWPDRWIDYVFWSGKLRLLSQQLALDGSERGAFASDHVSLEVELEFIT